MKNKTSLFIGIAVLALAMVFVGCAQFDKAVLAPTVSPAITNAATGIVTPPVTNYVVAPAISAGLAQAGQLAAPLVPPPYGFALDGALALIAAGLGLYARQKNGQLGTAQAITQAVVSGVEAAAHEPTKVAIQNAAAAAGVQKELDPIVQTIAAAMK